MGTVVVIIAFLIIFIIFVSNTSKENPSTQSGSRRYSPPSPQIIDVTKEFNIEQSVSDVGAFLFIDVETTGLPIFAKAKIEDLENWPRIVQIAWILCDIERKQIISEKYLVKQTEFIPESATRIHGITNQMCNESGIAIEEAVQKLIPEIKNSKYVIAHNIEFDIPVIESEFHRLGHKRQFTRKKKICTMKKGTSYCEIPRAYGRGYKYPRLTELYKELFYPRASRLEFTSIHDALTDTRMTAKCFFRMVDLGLIEIN